MSAIERSKSYIPLAVTLLIGFFLFSRADAFLMDYFTQMYGREEALGWSMLWLPILGELLMVVMVPVAAVVYGTSNYISKFRNTSGDER